MAKFSPGGLTFDSAFISEFRLTGSNYIGDQCPQSTIITGEDGNRYYIAGGEGGAGGEAAVLKLHNADTGALAVEKTFTEVDADADAEGITPPTGAVAAGGEGAWVAIPETPYLVAIFGAASGADSDKRVVYYKINSSGALAVVGGYAGRTGSSGDTQFSPPSGAGSGHVAAGHIIAVPQSGDNNTIPYKYPIVVAYYGEGRASVTVIPSINYIIANTPILENATDHWLNKERDLETTSFGTDIFTIDASTALFSRAFFLPREGEAGSIICLKFYKTDLDEHVAATASPANPFLTTNAPTYPNGLVSSLAVNLTPDSTPFGFTPSFGSSVRVAFHASLRNEDFSAAFPFPDAEEDFDGTAGTAADNYYCNPTIYPSDPDDPDQPWFMFFPRIYRASGDRDKIGIRVFAYDPKTGVATYLDFKNGQVYTIGSDVNANTTPNQVNVYWDRETARVDLLIKSSPSGEDAYIVTTFGTFEPVYDQSQDPGEDLKIRAGWMELDGHAFYVLRIGQQGTWAYDLTTGQWSQFATDGIVTWNFEKPAMWNGFPIGLDKSNPVVWKLDYDATQDEGSKDITRKVTGGYPVRGRNVVKCNAVRLTASVGAPDAASPTVSLRWSDDNGQTWSAFRNITIVNGDFDQELAWRALGVMRAPGRVFEIQDVGGLVRIDDADIEDGRDGQ